MSKHKNNTDKNMKELAHKLKNLGMKEYLAVIKVIEDEVNTRSKMVEEIQKENFDSITKALDRCFSASMILNTDYSLKEINHIFEQSWELIEDDTQKVKKLKKDGDGDYMKAAEKYVEKIQERSLELIEKNLSKKEAIETLVMEFPKSSKSMITNAYMKSKELEIEKNSLKNKSAELQQEALYNAIYDKNKKEEVKEMAETKAVGQVVKVKEDTKIKVLKMEVQGEFGIYGIEGNKLTIDDTEFNSKDHVEEVYRKQIEHLTRCKNEALKIYEIVEKVN